MRHTSEIRLDAPSSASVGGHSIRVASRALELLVTGVAAIATIAVLAIASAALFGVRLRIEQSGSMAPALEPGDLLLVKSIRPTDARPGQILTFPAPDRRIELTHRVVSMKRTGNRVFFVTRGDANSGVERWSAPINGRIGREIFAVPAVGGAIESLRGVPLVVVIWAAAPFLLVWLLRRIWRRE